MSMSKCVFADFATRIYVELHVYDAYVFDVDTDMFIYTAT